jgi:hypothetical protein
VYCPCESIVPAPAFGSPPLTDQSTAAASPPERLAQNLCTGPPRPFTPLQPVQFVSITADPGETENAESAVRAVTGPAPHPARIAKTGPIARNAALTSAFLLRPVHRFEAVNDRFCEICVRLSKGILNPDLFPGPAGLCFRLAHLEPHGLDAFVAVLS